MNGTPILKVLPYISVFAPLIPLWAGRANRQTLWWYMLTALACDMLLSFVFRPFSLNKDWVAVFYITAELLFISVYFAGKIPAPKRRRLLLGTAIAAIAFLVHALCDGIKFHTPDAGMIQAFYIILALAGFYLILKRQETTSVETSSFFWACVAFVINFSGNFLLFLFFSYLVKEKSQALAKLWVYIHCSLNIIYCVLMALSLHLQKRKF